ncbi:SH3 domain-containing protein [Allorhizobium undicola]|uniref:SH3 domain-containing protein n=1 Tax=Allorhizobium undicola TaxID=78527 RepID=UPI0012B66386|nr:SH3 domain-containing protein [Allorhizobium undicola]
MASTQYHPPREQRGLAALFLRARKTGHQRAGSAFALIGLVLAMAAATPSYGQTVITAPAPIDPVTGQPASPPPRHHAPDPYLWHVAGLPEGTTLDVRSGAGPAFRIIATLPEGMAVDMQNCMESRGGYWCRIATFERPRISGWVDGRFVEKHGGPPPQAGTIGGVPAEIIIDPFGKKQSGQRQGTARQQNGMTPDDSAGDTGE